MEWGSNQLAGSSVQITQGQRPHAGPQVRVGRDDRVLRQDREVLAQGPVRQRQNDGHGLPRCKLCDRAKDGMGDGSLDWQCRGIDIDHQPGAPGLHQFRAGTGRDRDIKGTEVAGPCPKQKVKPAGVKRDRVAADVLGDKIDKGMIVRRRQ